MTLKTHRVFLDGYITEKKARHAIAKLREIHDYAHSAPIEFVMNSQGGSFRDGIAIYSELAHLAQRGGGTHPVTTKVRGMCGSIATVIFQAGDNRVGSALDVLVFHETMLTFDGEFLTNIERSIRDFKVWEERFLDILMERATVSRKQIANLTGPVDRTLLIEEAIALGLADEVA